MIVWLYGAPSRLKSGKPSNRRPAWPAKVPLTIACGDYDRVKAIKEGRVQVEGCDVNFLPMYPEEIFFRAFRYGEFDVSELSFSSYIRTIAAGGSDYVGIPAFVSRVFRHSGIYVREGSGIEKPEDLRGKRVGLPEYQITAVVWMRGMLQHEYGVDLNKVTWVCNDDGHLAEFRDPPNVERTPPVAKKVDQMLLDGEVDGAILGADMPAEPRVATFRLGG